MKRLKRLIALLLCFLMMFPTQSIAVLAETEELTQEQVVLESTQEETVERIEETLPLETVERIEETLPLETIETESAESLGETPRIEETLPLQSLAGDTWKEDMVIYWNPGGVLPETVATASNAQKATASNAKHGSDEADGLSPSTPVKTLAAALERAKLMQEEEGVIASDITIYAMNPMEIEDGQLYVLTGGQIRIVSWPGRTYDNETIFYVNGGQLTLINTRLESGNSNTDGEEDGLVLVQGGSLQMGWNVEINGRIVMDYRDQTEELVWNVATESDASIKTKTATASDALDTPRAADESDADANETESGEAGFDLNDYILDSDEETLELLQDSKSASTWREPIIELLEDFYGAEKNYVLDVLGDVSTAQIELVKTLYADAESEEEFMELFALSETTDSSWHLMVETQTAGRLRNTTLSDGLAEAERLTLKTLVATPLDSGTIVYWNPGGPLTVVGTDGNPLSCPTGDDVLYDGKRPQAPVKTWEWAVSKASGGTIVCMQSVDLGKDTAASYVPVQGDGSFIISSSSPEVMVTLRSWEANVQPALIVPKGETLVLKNVVLRGLVRDGIESYVQTILSKKGSLILEENVTAEKGYIQIDAFEEMKNNSPVKVTSVDAASDGKVTLLFGGISENLNYRYVDVVVPWKNLKESAEQSDAEAERIGRKLLGRFQLHTSNRSTDYNGNSKYDWHLRQDTTEDDSVANPQNLELYADYYYDAVYLDGEDGRGDDSYYGATCQYPVKTWKMARSIWEKEMAKSIRARGEADAAGKTRAQIDELYPVPKTIYICGTVTIKDTQNWDLREWLDYDGEPIHTEVVSHVDIPLSEDGVNPVHKQPKVLVEVAEGAELMIKDVKVREITDEYDSVTIQVSGKLTLTGETSLTGERLAGGVNPAKEVTLGTHVKVKAGGIFVMNGAWNGAIERRQRGVDASGLNTMVRMESGYIRDNNSFEQSLFDEKLTTHQNGAGVVLSDRANFIMNGGAITENTVYAYGAGIYMTGDGTTFEMNKGEISSNKMAISAAYKDTYDRVNGYGIGIYAGSGTVLNIGNGSTPADEVIIKENKGYLVNGGGICTDGTLIINRATVSQNQASGNLSTKIINGIGICILENGTLSMDEGYVEGNHSLPTGSFNDYGNAKGAGIYIAYNGKNPYTPNYIKNSKISKNIIGEEYFGNSDKSMGGGIYSLDNLEIEGSVISYNEAQTGGGICFSSSSSNRKIKLDIKTTDIDHNIARRYEETSSTEYGHGGGIYLGEYVTLILNDGTKIFDNQANASGGGINMAGQRTSRSIIEMISETPGAIQIYENKSHNGGGIAASAATIKAKSVEIKNNTVTGGGGGVHLSSRVTAYMKGAIVSGNKAGGSGGGFYLTEYEHSIQLKDLEVSGNSATYGGGFSLSTWTTSESGSRVDLSETNAGDFKLFGNHASENGGGIYISGLTTLTMDIAGDIQNSADQHGSNLYQTNNGRMCFLSGNFKQPEEAKRVEGVYNIYLNDNSTSTSLKYFDLSNVTFEKKTEQNPEVIYLNTANSYLTYLTTPEYQEENNYATFPIDLNKDVFSVGSIVVKPANISKVEYQIPSDDLSGTVKITKDYTLLVNAETNLAYSSGGELPRRTQLGGFEEGKLINIALLGEGVYLSGAGSDTNEGTSPVDAVETFARAKELLIKRIKDADESDKDPDGFLPFIYICGQVNVEGDQVWELDYRKAEFDTKNQKYKDAEEDLNEPVYPAQVRRFTSFVDAPMIMVGDKNNTEVKFETGCIIIDGLADGVIPAIQEDKSPAVRVMKGSTAILTGESQIKNNYYMGMDIYGSLILTGEANETNKQLCNHHGRSVQMYVDSSIEMLGSSKILAEDEIKKIGSIGTPSAIFVNGDGVTITMKGSSSIEEKSNSNMIQYGIHSNYRETKIVMQDDASIKSTGSTMNSGVEISGTDQKFTMQDNARIDGGDNQAIVYAIHISGTKPEVKMNNSSQISNISYRGVYIDNPTNGSFEMNMNEDDEEENSAKIIDSYVGIYLGTGRGFQFSMGESALISVCDIGVELVGLGGTERTEILMQDNSAIKKCTYGFYSGSYVGVPISISMKHFAALEQNEIGLYEEGQSNWAITKLDFEMSDSSRVSGNEDSGLYFDGRYSYSFEKGHYRNITLKDNAVIGGNTYYDSEKPASGNQYVGIYSTGPITLQMSGTSKISGNGESEYSSDGNDANGICLTRNGNPYYYASGTSKITLSGDASVCNNRGGIYIESGISSKYPNPCEIVLDAIADDPDLGTPGTPSIQNNTDAVYLGAEGILKLQGAAFLGDTTCSDSDYDKRSLDCYGKLELDGRSIIEGRIYLQNSKHPITMTHKVPNDPTRSYHLWLAEGFMSHIVVQPDYVGMMDVTSPDDQLSYFYKDGGDGLVAEEEKTLVRQSPDIVLSGENNVYLSGTGLDINDGNSPSTAVRTFKRAKQLLKEGYYTTGANIIICNSVVQVKGAGSVEGDDSDWSFDEGGIVTNEKTGKTWKPLVVRSKDYDEQLISVDGSSVGFASEVTFKNITIDGGSEQGIILNGLGKDELLYIGTGKKAILGEGAVFQNNQAFLSRSYNTPGTSLGVNINGGTLEIAGGTIRNIVRETSYSGDTGGYIASAINCQSNGKIIIKSGQIVDNHLILPNFKGTGPGMGTIFLSNNCELEMSGGIIANNRVVSKTTSVVAAGAVVLYQANAKISGGIIRDNEGGKGSAIYYGGTQTGGGSLILSGGQITGNRTNATDSKNNVQKSQGLYSPIYIEGWDFQLKGGGADVRDNIYLNSTENLIKVSESIHQPGRKYHVFLNQGDGSTQFKKGSTVVQPDGIFINDATPYLSYFQVHSNPYILDMGRTTQSAGTVTNITERQCLILMRAVYLDSVKGKETNTGLTPKQAVDTFTRAKEIGVSGEGSQDYYVIYVSGKAVNTAAETEWTLPETAYLCRYTGFPVYESDGEETTEIELAYYNFLIEPAHPLKLEQIVIYGRRSIDTIENKGDSLINIKPGIQVIMGEGAILERNYNVGSYVAEDGKADNLITQGGAIRVEAGGTLHMNAGIIQDTDAAYGSAIYLEAGKTEGSPQGHLYLTGSPGIVGSVYLDGTGSATAAFVEPDGTYKPTAALKISLRNDYNERPVVSYCDGTVISQEHIDYYTFDDAIKGAYDVVKRGDTILELKIKKVIYLDGEGGKETGDGKTPDSAFGTLKQVYESIGYQTETHSVLVFIVNTVEISALAEGPDEVLLSNILIKEEHDENYYEGTYQDSDGDEVIIRGQVYFKRYVKPDGYPDNKPEEDSVYYGFGVETHKETLFSVADGGKLTLNGIYVDGHSQDSQNAVDVTIVAKGITAESPLIRVDKTGELICRLSRETANSVPTAGLFANNINNNNKDSENDIIGELKGAAIKEGSSAGIELLNGGTCTLEKTQFNNLHLGREVVSGGTDVYSNGILHFSEGTHFSGSVFLEGFGTFDEKQETSRYLIVDVYGEPVDTSFQVLMRDPYNGRDVVHFQKGVHPETTDIGLYLLEERIKNFFYLTNKSEDEPHILELHVPMSVYIDGSKGNDDQEDRVAGSTPKTPVKSLKRAFELLKTRGGNTIYVVDTVKLTDNAYITGNSYRGNGEPVLLGSTDKVQIIRYIQPDFARANAEAAVDAGYDVEDFTGVLLNVGDSTNTSTSITVRFGANVFFDGHSEPKKDEDNTIGLIVSGYSEAKAPLIKVEDRNTLELEAGVTLQDNNNTYRDGETGMDGGVLYNSGTTTVNGALFTNNKADQGSGVYQDGTFTILGGPENLADHSFYLTTDNTGTDHIIQTAVMIPDGQIFDVDMDHAVKGRDVVRFTDSSAYTPNADAEHEHFRLGSKVPKHLFLVQDVYDEMVLELQDWEMFDVEVPTDIYLVVNQKGSNHLTSGLSGIRTEAEGTSIFSAPEYTIKNKGIYDVEVSVKEFVNQNTEVGITHDVMNLMDRAVDAINNTDLYLAVKGLDDGSGGTGFTMAETSLKPYAEAVVTEAPAKLGVLKAGTDGNFTFVGKVGNGFIEKYLDPDFPIEGKTREEAQQHMDGTSNDGLVHSRAKYGLKYKLEMAPPRRERDTTP